jgi:hypothetical protein
MNLGVLLQNFAKNTYLAMLQLLHLLQFPSAPLLLSKSLERIQDFLDSLLLTPLSPLRKERGWGIGDFSKSFR